MAASVDCSGMDVVMWDVLWDWKLHAWSQHSGNILSNLHTYFLVSFFSGQMPKQNIIIPHSMQSITKTKKLLKYIFFQLEDLLEPVGLSFSQSVVIRSSGVP